jgi:hypothetical protein
MKRNIYFLILAALGTFPGHGQIAAWDFYGQSFPVTCAASTFHPNLVTADGANNITRGTGAPASGGVNSFRTTGFQNNGISTASSDYFQVTLQPLPGFKLSLSTLDAKFNGTTTFYASPGVTSQFAYSLDGTNFILIGNPVQSASLTMAQVDLTAISDLQHVYAGTTITLRYYASGQTATGGWGFYSAATGSNGLAIGGEVTTALITAPSLQATGITFSNIQQTQMAVSWIPGDGEKRLVKINTTNSFTDPANGTDPPANAVYAGSGEQVVYNYSGTSIPAVTGLAAGVTYWFRVYEYNGSGLLTMFNTVISANNPGSQATSAIMLPPVINSPTSSAVTTGSAILGGHIISDGGSPLTERGSVWNSGSPVTITDHKLPEGGLDTGFFSHQRNELPPASMIHYAAYSTNSVGTAMTQESTFFTLATEPVAHVEGFMATAAGTTSINLSWNGLTTGADGYLILQRQGSTGPSGAPADGNQYNPGVTVGDAVVAANIPTGSAGTATITGLSPGTPYGFSIFPYAWDGTNQQTTNYRTQSPVPLAFATTGIPPVATYHWTGASGTDWNVPGNWNPARTVPALNDILIFDIGGIWTITNVPNQTIGQLRILGEMAVTLQGLGTLNVAGDTGEDLLVEWGCHLNISGSGAVSISLAAGATGLVHGGMTFSGGGHRLVAASVNGVVFSAGSMFKSGSGFTGNPFGTVNLNSIVFSQGSLYVCQAGGNPFGAAAPSSVVVFQPGSLYRIDAYVVPSLGGRTYGNFEMNYPGSITATGSSAVTIGNFIASQGTFYFNVTGTPGHSIRGNITIASVATLIFNPASAGTVILNGISPQLISGNGSLMAGTFSTLKFTNSTGVTMNLNATLHHVTIGAGGLFTIAPNAELTVNGNLINEGAASGLVIDPEGSMIHNNTGVAGTVRRLIQAASWTDWQDGWHFLSSPVAGQPFNTDGGFITSGSNNDYDLFAWSEPDNLWVSYKNNSQPPFFYGINGSNNFETGRAYLCAYQQGGEKVFSGTLNVADVLVGNLTCTGSSASSRGWHLLGNPFPCALSWYIGWTTSNIGGVAYVWNEAAMSYTPRNPGEEIPACNGFMVQVTENTGNTGSLTIPATKRIHGSQAWYKVSNYPVIKLFARNIDIFSFQECQVRFNPQSTENFDIAFDGRFLPGYAPAFYSLWNGDKLAVNSLPAPARKKVIPLGFEKNVGKHFQIEAQITGDISCQLLLADKKRGIEHNLTLFPVYEFIAEDGDAPGRFELRFGDVVGGEPLEQCAKVYSYGNGVVVNHHGDIRIEIFTIAGKLIAFRELSGAGTCKLLLSQPAGLYLARVSSGNETMVTKVFINSKSF